MPIIDANVAVNSVATITSINTTIRKTFSGSFLSDASVISNCAKVKLFSGSFSSISSTSATAYENVKEGSVSFVNSATFSVSPNRIIPISFYPIATAVSAVASSDILISGQTLMRIESYTGIPEYKVRGVIDDDRGGDNYEIRCYKRSDGSLIGTATSSGGNYVVDNVDFLNYCYVVIVDQLNTNNNRIIDKVKPT